MQSPHAQRSIFQALAQSGAIKNPLIILVSVFRRLQVIRIFFGLINSMSLIFFALPMLIIGFILFGAVFMFKPSGSNLRYVGDCSLPKIAEGTIYEDKKTRKRSCSRYFLPGSWIRGYNKYFNCTTSTGERGLLTTIPDPAEWGLRRPEIMVCYVNESHP